MRVRIHFYTIYFLRSVLNIFFLILYARVTWWNEKISLLIYYTVNENIIHFALTLLPVNMCLFINSWKSGLIFYGMHYLTSRNKFSAPILLIAFRASHSKFFLVEYMACYILISSSTKGVEKILYKTCCSKIVLFLNYFFYQIQC